MPYLKIWVNESTLAVLNRLSTMNDTSIEQIAADAVESEAVSHLPGGLPGMHFGPNADFQTILRGIVHDEYGEPYGVSRQITHFRR